MKLFKKSIPVLFCLFTLGLTGLNADQRPYIEAYKAYAEYKMGHYDKAFTMYRDLANSGSVQGMVNLGHMYLNGQGTEQDYDMAAHWYLQGALAGDQNSMFELSQLLAQQPELLAQQNGVFWLEKSAQMGHNDAQLEMYHTLRLSQPSIAAQWLRHAADNGNIDASEMLATEHNENTIVDGRLIDKLKQFYKRMDVVLQAQDRDKLGGFYKAESEIIIQQQSKISLRFSVKEYQHLWQKSFDISEDLEIRRSPLIVRLNDAKVSVQSVVYETLYNEDETIDFEIQEYSEFQEEKGQWLISLSRLSINRQN